MTYPYYKHRREIRNHRVFIVILIAIILILLFRSPNITTKKLKGIINTGPSLNFQVEDNIEGKTFTDFKDFNENPEEYVGKNISARGLYTVDIFPKVSTELKDYLVDDEGYELLFKPKINRNFGVGQRYTIIGIITYEGYQCNTIIEETGKEQKGSFNYCKRYYLEER